MLTSVRALFLSSVLVLALPPSSQALPLTHPG